MKHFYFLLVLLSSMFTMSAQNISLSFENPEITTDGLDSFYEVDVMISSDIAFSLGSGQFFLDYNPVAFGTQVDNNGMIAYERPDTSLLGGEVSVDVGGTPIPLGAHYTSFISNDTEDAKVSFIYQQSASGGMYGDNVPAGTPVVLVHVKIRFLPEATGEDPSVCFDETNPFDDQFFTACGPYDPLVDFNFENANCQGEPGSQIFDYTPDCDVSIPFEISCQDITVQLNTSGTIEITADQVYDGDANDPTIESLTIDVDSFDCSNVGENTVTLTVVNVDSESSTCEAIVTVEDTIDPEAVCQDITVQLDANGNVSITAIDVDGGSTDNCEDITLSIDNDTFDCSNIGENTVILTVTDASGNVTSCEATVTIEDILVPEALCQNITVELDEDGNATITAAQVDGGSTDNCGVASLSISQDTFTIANIGDNTITLTVTDDSGNTDTCTAIVTIPDTIAPVAICQNITVQLDTNGQATIVAGDVDNNSTDETGIGMIAVDITSFDCSNIGENTVTLTVTDTSGNVDSCTAIVTVEDNIAPEITCIEDQTEVLESGVLEFEVPDYVALGEITAVDTCTDPVITFTQTPSPGTLVGEGVETITICATDNSGNENCCTFELTVETNLSIDDIQQVNIQLYPNPTTDNITISNPNTIVLTTADVYDVHGRLLKTFNVRASSNFTFDVTSLAKGNYFLRINSENGSVVKRFIKR